ncbi:MAG: A/G-specific adenine glycosylase [Gemmatimonadota bacterium]
MTSDDGRLTRADDLLDWFASRGRDVPWRAETDPYRIWVCEVMAQQTRIATVRERLPDFLATYPTLESLAESDMNELLLAWEGLGYYARARNLRRAARQLIEHGQTRLPSDVSELRRLPGIGPYTAGALASIAFGQAEPAVDGNVRRVLARLFDLPEATMTTFQARARELITEADRGLAAGESSRAGILNQALMDLGGEVCTPRSPACGACPLGEDCLALERGTVSDRPLRRRRAALTHHDIAVALIWHSGRLLIQRRPEQGLLGGLWEFPGGKVETSESPEQAAVREVLEETGLSIRLEGPAGVIDHAYSHFRITLHAFHAELDDEHTAVEQRAAETERRRWVRPAELDAFAFPTANRRLLVSMSDRARPVSVSG